MATAILSPAMLAVSAACADAAGLVTVGWIEHVKLGIEGVVVVAKLDTGANTSSLHAKDIRLTSRDDGDWVAFDVLGRDGVVVRFERKVVRISRVKRASGGTQNRPVILLGVCLGHVYRLTEVNLTDRSRFKYELLVGRRFLAPHFAVDSSSLHTVEPMCAENSRQ